MSVKAIIQTHRSRMETLGLLRRVEPVALSPRVANMRLSLTKVRAALAERSNWSPAIQPSPLAILFDHTLPKIEHILVDFGETRAEQIISRLCEHGKAMIEQHGAERAKGHLEELFTDLPNYEARVREENGVEEIIEAYRLVEFEGREEGYLKLKLGDKVRELKISANGKISLFMESSTTDSDLIYLRRAQNLQELNLSYTSVSDAGLKHLSGLANLRELNLGGTPVSDAGLIYLRGLANLQKLSLWRTRVSDAGLKHLSGLANLQELSLSGTEVSDAGLIHLSGLANLQELSLLYTKVSDAGLEHLSGLANLQKLNLSHTRVSDAGLIHLSGLANLQELNLGDTKVSDAGLKHLSGLANLRELNLVGTKVSDDGVGELKWAIPGLEVIK